MDDTAACGHLSWHRHGMLLSTPLVAPACLQRSGTAAAATTTARQPFPSHQCQQPRRRGLGSARYTVSPATTCSKPWAGRFHTAGHHALPAAATTVPASSARPACTEHAAASVPVRAASTTASTTIMPHIPAAFTNTQATAATTAVSHQCHHCEHSTGGQSRAEVHKVGRLLNRTSSTSLAFSAAAVAP